MSFISGTIENLDVVVTGLENAELEVREAAFQGVLLALNAAFKASATLISAQDHTLRELAVMGHPYSASHGFAIHDPDELIHVQSGEYRDALRKISPQGSGGQIIEGKVQIDASMADLDRWLQEGNAKLRARPWMQYIVDNYGEDFAQIIEANIQAAIAKLQR